ncbi:DUF6320 domain-containing protein [Fusibacter bizertensis]
MNRCNQCKVYVKDNHAVCPLCQSVLEKSETDEATENLYPNVKVIAKRIDLMIRIYAFSAIVVETLLAYFNYRTYEHSYWSVLVGVVLFYVFMALKITFKEGYEYRTKSILMIILAVICVVLIDALTGFRGWSLNYVLPSAIILLNTGIIVAMFVNIRNWQSYMMIELFTIFWSILPFILNKLDLLTNLILSQVATAYSIFLFLGTIIIGGKRASNELKRRFHVR